MNVLVIGSGGREHALVWKLKQSPLADKIYCAPGNAGIAEDAECVNIRADELDRLLEFAKRHAVDLTVVGPEAPLCAGIADRFRAAGLTIFGPDAEAARLEGSKDYAKRFMQRHDIPTAKSVTFSAFTPAAEYVRERFSSGVGSIVVKADGLAAGKGVLVAGSADSAITFISECFGGSFGDSGRTVLVEECLSGEEASILALTDGRTIVPLASSQDHKRAYDHDAGPNTGGMGAYSPAPVITTRIMSQIRRTILQPFLCGIQEENLLFRGVIFVGVMVTERGPKVLEFNVRFGDPEIQPILRRFDGDLLDVLMKTAQGRLGDAEFRWSADHAVSVVIASGGYPGSYEKNYPICGLKEAAATGAVVFHAGTSVSSGEIVSSGGRVLGVSARGGTIRDAVDRAYRAVDLIHFKDCFCRRDIAARALAKEALRRGE